MGCDIHLHIEVKINGQWHHYSNPNVPRSYHLFGFMAGVRYDEVEPISQPKGVPIDLTPVTRAVWDYDYGDSHTPSWLSWDEIVRLYDAWEKHRKKNGWDSFDSDLDHKSFGYLAGNSWCDKTNTLDGVIQDVRFIFWFDN